MPQRMLKVGEPAPWFECRSPVTDRFHFESVAGRYVVLCFFASAGDPVGRRVLADIFANRQFFDDTNRSLFGVSIDRDDESTGRVQNKTPGIRFFWDFDRAVSGRFGAIGPPDSEGGPVRYNRFSMVLDERLRVLAIFPIDEHPEQHATNLIEYLKSLPVPSLDMPAAPILTVPRIFEPEFCRTLIEYYESRGGKESGVMTEREGKTVHKLDDRTKRRRDQQIVDDSLQTSTMHRIADRLAPEVYKAFQFRATRIERYIVVCYDSATGGHFHAHRDNTTKGTAHRRFAVSINLNAEFEGGDLRFPEFGPRTYKPPAGGAVVFSCSLLHEVTPITAGRRYAFLPFLYDDAAAKIREDNFKYISHEA